MKQMQGQAQSGTVQPSRHSHAGRNAVVIVLVVVVALAGIYYAYPALVRAAPSVAYPNVTVSGVLTLGVAVHPIRVDFITAAGSNYSARVNGGNYTLVLRNGQNYKVTVAWAGPPGFNGGTCNAGILNLNTATSTYDFSTVC